jgi:hypothetical protein
VPWDEDYALEKLTEAVDAEELCRRLLRSPWSLGSSTCHGEAIELLRRVHGTGELPASFVAMLLCTCHRWDRATGRLISAVEECRLLSARDLDELAESFLSYEMVVAYPITWVTPQWLELDLDGGEATTIAVSEDTVAEHRPRIPPPLRRWAAARALRARAARLDELLDRAQGFDPRDRYATIHGLLDAADVLEPAERRRLARRGLSAGQARVRRAALERMCELDGVDAAQRRARSDPDATVRAWRPAQARLTAAAGP